MKRTRYARMSYSHRHSTSEQRVWYVDGLFPALARDPALRLQAELFAHRMGNGARVAPFYDIYIIIAPRGVV